MVDDDVFDVVRVDADLPDIRLDHVDEGLLRGVEQDVALRSLQRLTQNKPQKKWVI